MSGIIGMIHGDGSPLPPALLRRMTEFLAYRGPDGLDVHAAGVFNRKEMRLFYVQIPESHAGVSSLRQCNGEKNVVRQAFIRCRLHGAFFFFVLNHLCIHPCWDMAAYLSSPFSFTTQRPVTSGLARSSPVLVSCGAPAPAWPPTNSAIYTNV